MPTNFSELIGKFIELLTMLVPIVFALTIIVLFWGIIKAWIINGGDETAVAEGKKMAVAGIIALVLMVGIWGLLGILQRSLF